MEHMIILVLLFASTFLLSAAAGYAFGFFQLKRMKLYRLVIVTMFIATVLAEFRTTGNISTPYLTQAIFTFVVMGCSAELTSSLRLRHSKSSNE